MLNKRKVLVSFVFLVYIAFLIAILFLGGRHASSDSFNSYIQSNVNLIPFDTISVYYNGFIHHKSYSFIALTNLIANLIIFLPMGLFLPLLFNQKNLFRFSFIMIIMLIGVELLQLILKIGIFDIDDIILNFAGAFIGYILFCFCCFVKKLR